MSELPTPIRDALRDGGSELGAQRVWARLSTSLDAPAPRSPTRALFIGLAAAALLASVLWWAWPSTRAPVGPLSVNGAPPDLHALTATPAELALSDGSRLRSLRPSRLELLENSAQVFSVFLHLGEVEFEVQSGGPRRWTVETGLVTVEVVGTKFTVTRTEDDVRVSVERGVVLVRGERVPNRVRRLEHGQFFELAAPVAAAPPEPVRAVDAGSPLTPPLRGRKPTVQPPEEPDAGEVRSVEQPTAEELFAAADVSRLTGHPQEAAATLQRLIDTVPDDPLAPVAAFTLGKLQLEQLEALDDASLSFERALSMGLPEALREQAFTRWLEALRRAGNAERCREVGERYRSLFPAARNAGATRECAPE